MEDKVFLEKSEVEIIQNLQINEDQITTQLGQLEYQICILQNQKETLTKKVFDLQLEKDKLGKSLQEKYGEGTIDTSSGEFIKFK